MIQLYERDATAVAEVLDLLAQAYAIRGNTPQAVAATMAVNEWKPADFTESRMRTEYPNLVVADRLSAIVAAINQQLQPGA